ncbi:MAG: translation initiation factor IF-2 subunit alpha [Nanoarchaeota archaeon]|nr:translation initiation factor IF-2 subunit alpha [Nanoarchaeota archaeon]
MFYKKQGLPETNEIVLCTVTKILFHSVFVTLDEYQKEGMIHISEISPGRIRNLRDFVKEGKKIVCKILRINQEKGHIDLSLRRVSTSQKRNKIQEIKQEEKSENILKITAKDLKIDLETIYKEAGSKILEKYPSLTECFQEIVNSNFKLSTLNIKSTIADKIEKYVKEKIKPPKVNITGTLNLQSHSPEGINIIKKTLKHVLSFKNTEVLYLGAPKYKLTITDSNYKDAEINLKKITDSTLEFIKKLKGSGEFIRNDRNPKMS